MVQILMLALAPVIVAVAVVARFGFAAAKKEKAARKDAKLRDQLHEQYHRWAVR